MGRKSIKSKMSCASAASLVDGFPLMTKKEVIEILKNHELLERLSQDQLGAGEDGAGKLVWARNPGSVFWPALIATLDDKPGCEAEDEEVAVPPEEYRSVMFLESAFRYSLLEWKDLILVTEEDFETQKELVINYNKCVIKRNWRAEKPFRDAVDLLKEFIQLDISDRQGHAFQLSLERKQIKSVERAGKKKSTLSISSSAFIANGHAAENDCALDEKGEQMARKRTSERYSLREIKTPTRRGSSPEQQSRIKSTSRSPTPTPSSEASGENHTDSASERSRKVRQRPKVGGLEMKNFAIDRFLSIDKTYKYDSKKNFRCATCLEDISSDHGKHLICHELPHHKDCLLEVKMTLKDGTAVIVRKCRCCSESLCYQCKSKTKGEEAATKCSKCDLYFHRSCLDAWPQAQIQGSSGPITCPVHFCHTCIGESRVYLKTRNTKAFSGQKFRCLQCLSTYHRPHCIPAGTAEDITGTTFIICPRHTLPHLKITQRRFGCLTCGKTIKPSHPQKIECRTCLQNFHAECVGYTEEKAKEMSVESFGSDYRCGPCIWGVFPLYGQVVWYQQTGHSFWPARVLYPKEVAGRLEYCRSRITGEYSIKYFGSVPTYYDKASRTFPLHLATVKLLTACRVYQETDKIRSAYDEAVFFDQCAQELRDGTLPKPEPFYKKIDRNVYRNSQASTKKKTESTGTCYCHKKADDFCTLNSGCHNRDTAVECNDNNCQAGERCQNRMFSLKQKDKTKPIECKTEEFLAKGKGWAVKAAKNFKPGEFIIEYCGEIINKVEMQYRANKKQEEDPLYILEIDTNTFIDAEYCGNVSRLINHSCEPNCRTEKYTSAEGKPVVGVFAQQDIPIGEELTFDYAYGNKSAAPFRCYCGTKTCRGFIGKMVTSEEEIITEVADPELEQYDKQCAKCSFGGLVLCCDFDGCLKVYHIKCAGLSREPENDWYCPDHKVFPQNSRKRKVSKKSACEPPAKKALVNGKKTPESRKSVNAKRRKCDSVKRNLNTKQSVTSQTIITGSHPDDGQLPGPSRLARMVPFENNDDLSSSSSLISVTTTGSKTVDHPISEVQLDRSDNNGIARIRRQIANNSKYYKLMEIPPDSLNNSGTHKENDEQVVETSVREEIPERVKECPTTITMPNPVTSCEGFEGGNQRVACWLSMNEKEDLVSESNINDVQEPMIAQMEEDEAALSVEELPGANSRSEEQPSLGCVIEGTENQGIPVIRSDVSSAVERVETTCGILNGPITRSRRRESVSSQASPPKTARSNETDNSHSSSSSSVTLVPSSPLRIAVSSNGTNSQLSTSAVEIVKSPIQPSRRSSTRNSSSSSSSVVVVKGVIPAANLESSNRRRNSYRSEKSRFSARTAVALVHSHDSSQSSESSVSFVSFRALRSQGQTGKVVPAQLSSSDDSTLSSETIAELVFPGNSKAVEYVYPAKSREVTARSKKFEKSRSSPRTRIISSATSDLHKSDVSIRSSREVVATVRMPSTPTVNLVQCGNSENRKRSANTGTSNELMDLARKYPRREPRMRVGSSSQSVGSGLNDSMELIPGGTVDGDHSMEMELSSHNDSQLQDTNHCAEEPAHSQRHSLRSSISRRNPSEATGINNSAAPEDDLQIENMLSLTGRNDGGTGRSSASASLESSTESDENDEMEYDGGGEEKGRFEIRGVKQEKVMLQVPDDVVENQIPNQKSCEEIDDEDNQIGYEQEPVKVLSRENSKVMDGEADDSVSDQEDDEVMPPLAEDSLSDQEDHEVMPLLAEDSLSDQEDDEVVQEEGEDEVSSRNSNQDTDSDEIQIVYEQEPVKVTSRENSKVMHSVADDSVSDQEDDEVIHCVAEDSMSDQEDDEVLSDQEDDEEVMQEEGEDEVSSRDSNQDTDSDEIQIVYEKNRLRSRVEKTVK